ncbi:MAG: hypothetical protein JSV66_07085 [Trueperaceae bacterium]|nr:MAG: hypothetical protein JSV66_07085 [Trueperaceae bacterium]
MPKLPLRLLTLIGLLALLILAVILPGKPILGSHSTRIDAAQVQKVCEEGVTERLAPHSATFVSSQSAAWIEPVELGDKWFHTVVAMSEDPAGASTRSQWSCTVDGKTMKAEVIRIQ